MKDDFQKIHQAVKENGGWYELEERLKGHRQGNLKRQVRTVMNKKIQWWRDLLNEVGLDFEIIKKK